MSNQKGYILGYDEIILSPVDDTECLYCLKANQIEAILGIIEPLAWSKRWMSESMAEIVKDEIEAFRDDIARRLMMSCCPDDGTQQILHRVNPETNMGEISIDGGETWLPDPEDPRVSGVQLPPVGAGESGDCDAATNGVSNVANAVNQMISARTDAATLAEFLLAIAAVLIATFVGAVWALFPAICAGIVNLLYSMDAAAISAAFAGDTYDELKCLFFCNVGDDGAFTEDGFLEMIAEIPEFITNTDAREILGQIFSVWGLIGTNNALALGTASGTDCDCDCSTCAAKWALSYPENPIFGQLIELNEAEGWVEFGTDEINVNNLYYIDIRTPDFEDCCTLDMLPSDPPGVPIAWQNCGEAFTAVDFHTGLATGQCVHHLQPSSALPFTMKFYFSNCP